MDLLLNTAARKQSGQPGNNEKYQQDAEEPFLKLISSSVVRKTPAGFSPPPRALRPADSTTAQDEASPRRTFTGTSVEEAVTILKNQPDYDSLMQVLTYLTADTEDGRVRITTSSPATAQATHLIISDVVPNYWTILNEGTLHSQEDDAAATKEKGKRRAESKDAAKPSSMQWSPDAALLLSSVRSITGLNGIMLRLSELSQEAERGNKEQERREDVAMNLHALLEVLGGVLEGDDSVVSLWSRTASLATPAAAVSERDKRRKLMEKRVMWSQLLALLSGEKIVGVAAEAEDKANAHLTADKEKRFWFASGKEFSAWKARNLVSWMRILDGPDDADDIKRCSELLSKSGKGIYGEAFMRYILAELVFASGGDMEPFKKLTGNLLTHERHKLFTLLLTVLAEKHLNSLGSDIAKDHPLVSTAAGLLKSLLGDELGTEYLVSWLASNSGCGLGDEIAIRRAVVAVVAENKEAVISALERTMEIFGDMLYVRHAPILQQEVHAQALLLLAGYVDKVSHMKLTTLLRGTTFLESVSNRLTAPQVRARFLGMVVGEALSSMVDLGSRKLDFHMEETKSDEGEWYKSLISLQDSVGDPAPLFSSPTEESDKSSPPPKKAKIETPLSKPRKQNASEPAPVAKPSMPRQGFIIEEIDDDGDEEEDEDADLVPYEKPASDASDSEEDPTMIRRDKPKPPVYIRDLISYFRATDDYDRHVLALRTAPDLIRRKGKFGTEVSEHAETLATLLVGVDDKYDLEDFEDLRCDGLVALATALPEKLGPWLARTFWTGDYNAAQRRTILVAVGLTGRELAGLEGVREELFPSKRLPEQLERLFLEDPSEDPYSNALAKQGGEAGGRSKKLKPLPPTALEGITHDLTRKFLAPMAAEAADRASGPDSLKLETYKQRLEAKLDAEENPSTGSGAFLGKGKVIRQTTRLKTPAGKPIPNTSANIISKYLVSPISSRLVPVTLRTASGWHIFSPLVPLAVRTLSILLHAAGPNTLALPQMTGELWDALLALRQKCVGDLALTGAVVEGFVMLLDVNGISGGEGMVEVRVRDLCGNWGREIQETMDWVGLVFEGLRGAEGGNANAKIKGLGGRGGEEKSMWAGETGDRTEEARIKAMAAGVLVRLQETTQKYQDLMFGLGK